VRRDTITERYQVVPPDLPIRLPRECCDDVDEAGIALDFWLRRLAP
jgi:hypothetical protein